MKKNLLDLVFKAVSIGYTEFLLCVFVQWSILPLRGIFKALRNLCPKIYFLSKDSE